MEHEAPPGGCCRCTLDPSADGRSTHGVPIPQVPSSYRVPTFVEPASRVARESLTSMMELLSVDVVIDPL